MFFNFFSCLKKNNNKTTNDPFEDKTFNVNE